MKETKKCMDCGIDISSVSKRCRKCHFKTKQGVNHPNYGKRYAKKKEPYYCVDCKKEIAWHGAYFSGVKKCRSCSQKGKKLSIEQIQKAVETRRKNYPKRINLCKYGCGAEVSSKNRGCRKCSYNNSSNKSNPNYKHGKFILLEKPCPYCKKIFTGKKSRVFCSRKCSNLYQWKYTNKKEIVSNKSQNFIFTDEIKNKMSKNHADVSGKNNPMYGKVGAMKGKTGSLSPCWQGGKTPIGKLIRQSLLNINWKKEVFKRDNYTCQECSKKGGKIEAHHIKGFSIILREFLQTYSQFSPIEDKDTLLRLSFSYDPFWNISNGKTLCKECHSKHPTYVKNEN